MNKSKKQKNKNANTCRWAPSARSQMVPICIALISLFSSLFISTPVAYAGTFNKPTNLLSISTGLVGWWTFDGKNMVSNVADSSGQGNHGNLNGQTSTTTVPGKLGQALSFDGSNDYVALGDVNDLSGSQGVTVSAWVRPSAIGTNGILWRGESSVTKAYSLFLLSTDEIRFRVTTTSTGSETSAALDTTTSPISTLNQWYHIAGIYSDSDDTMRIYVNGSQVVSNGALASGVLADGAFIETIGSSNTSNLFNGSLDDVRIYNRALTATEVRQLYNLGAATKVNTSPRATSGAGLNAVLVGYWTFDGKDTPWTSATAATTIDKSGNGNTGTLTSMNQATSPASGKLGQALSFDKVDDYVNVGSASSLDDIQLQGGGGVTYSVWIYPRSNGEGGNGEIIQKSFFSAGGWGFYTASNDLRFQKDFDGANNLIAFTNNDVLQFNQWYHVVMTWDGSALISGVGFYVNGVNQTTTGTSNGDGNAVSDAALSIIIGGISGSFTFDGFIDDVRVYNRVLSAGEVTQLYNQGAATKVNASPRATSGAGLNSGLVGYWTFDGKNMTSNVADSSGSGNTGYLLGQTSTTTVLGKLGQALSFDGVDDYVSLSNFSNFNFSKPATFSAWVKSTSTSETLNSLYAVGDKDQTHEYTAVYFGGNPTGSLTNELIAVARQYEPDSSTYIVGYTTTNRSEIFNGKWHLITITWSDSVRIYLDGVSKTVSVGTGSNNGTYGGHPGVDTALIGGSMYNGTVPYGKLNTALDDVRIYNRALTATEIQQLYNLGR